jgi:hypothetical protein
MPGGPLLNGSMRRTLAAALLLCLGLAVSSAEAQSPEKEWLPPPPDVGWPATSELPPDVGGDYFADSFDDALADRFDAVPHGHAGGGLEEPWPGPHYFAATSANFAWLAGGGREGFGSFDVDLHRTWQWQLGDAEPLLIAPGGGIHFWSGPGVLDLPPRVYDLYLDLSWRFLSRERWGIAGGITPGFYGDFGRIDARTFQFTGWLLGDWSPTEHWTLLGGVAYVRQLRSNLLPIGGVVWRPSDDWRLEAVVPNPRVARRLWSDQSSEAWMYVRGAFGGGAWAVDDGPENVLVQYSDLRLALGAEWYGPAGGATSLEMGYVFSRELAVNGFPLVAPNGTALLQITSTF